MTTSRRERKWGLLVLLGHVLSGVAFGFVEALEPAPAGFEPVWVWILLLLSIGGAIAFVALQMPQKELRAGNPAVGKGQLIFLTAAFWFCIASAAAIVLFLSYNLFFVMPPKLHGTWRRFTTAVGLLSNDVNGVAVDRHGNVWFATEKGMSVMTPEEDWTYYRASTGLGIDEARDVVVDALGRIWVATLGGGVRCFDGAGWRGFTSANSGLPDDYALRLAVDGQGNVWVLSRGGIPAIRTDGTIDYVGEGPPGTPISAAVDGAGDVWVATMDSAALARYDPDSRQWYPAGTIKGHFTNYETVAVNAATIWGAAADRQPGHIWLAADSMIEVEGGNWRVHEPQYQPSAVCVDPDGYKWFAISRKRPGYASGLAVHSPDGRNWWFYRAGSGKDGIRMLDWIDAIACGSPGSIWFMGMDGVVRLTP